MSTFHLSLKRRVIGVTDRLHAEGKCGVNVLLLVIQKQDLGGGQAETFGRGGVNRGLRLTQQQLVGPDRVVKLANPIELVTDTCGHGIADIGQDARAYTRPVQVLHPGDHGLIHLGPQLDIQGRQLGAGCAIERRPRRPRNLFPVALAVQGTAIVLVTGLPVGAIECLRRKTARGLHFPPDNGVWRSA